MTSLGYGPIIPRPDEAALAPAGAGELRELRTLARRLAGRRVLFLTLDRDGGTTGACVRVLRHLGVDAQWLVVESAADRAALAEVEDQREWMATSFRIACDIPGTWDVGVVAGRELAGIAAVASERAGAWVMAWGEADTDLGAAWPSWCLPAFARFVLDRAAIDPAAAANVELPVKRARRECRALGIDPDRGLLCQVSGPGELDRAGGALAAYWRIKEALPAVQLALACPLPPETDAARGQWRRLQAQASEDPDVHLLSSGRPEHVNAVRTCAGVVLAGVTRPAFGPGAAEAAYRGKPVIARRGGSADNVVEYGLTGYLTDSPGDSVAWAIDLLAHPRRAAKLGRAGRRRVERDLLLHRLVRDWLRLIDELASPRGRRRAASWLPSPGPLVRS